MQGFWQKVTGKYPYYGIDKAYFLGDNSLKPPAYDHKGHDWLKFRHPDRAALLKEKGKTLCQ